VVNVVQLGFARRAEGPGTSGGGTAFLTLRFRITEVLVLKKSTFSLVHLLSALTLVLVVAGPGPDVSAEEGSVISRVLATERAAVELSPSLGAIRAAVSARRAETQADAAAGTPYVELQQEGLGSGFDWQSNAQTTLRIGTPFNLPAHSRARRDLRDASEAWSVAAYGAAVLENTGEVGQRWIELAAVEERLAVATRRLTRLQRALALQRVRLDLGEVAGTDVTQIELAWAGVMSTVWRLESDRKAAVEALRQHCADRCVFPQEGDLEGLSRLTSTLKVDGDPSVFLEGSPLWKSRGLRAAMEQGDARVMEAKAWGRPEAEVEWEHVPGLEGLPSYDAFGVKFRFPLPTGSAGTKAREAARARMMEAEARLRLERTRMKSRLERALAAARAAEKTLDQLEPVLLKVEDAEHSLAEQFRLGAISYLVYMDGVSRFDDVRLQAVDARRSLLRARLELAVLSSDPRCFPIPEPPKAPESQREETQP